MMYSNLGLSFRETLPLKIANNFWNTYFTSVVLEFLYKFRLNNELEDEFFNFFISL